MPDHLTAPRRAGLLCLLACLSACTPQREIYRQVAAHQARACALRLSIARTASDSVAILEDEIAGSWSYYGRATCASALTADTLPKPRKG